MKKLILITCLIFSFIISGTAYAKLYFPHVDTNDPWGTEIAIINTSADQTITATFMSSCGANIDESSIVMIVHGNAVTPTITGSGSQVIVTYTPPTALEKDRTYQVTVTAQDVNGNVGEKTWGFYIAFSC